MKEKKPFYSIEVKVFDGSQFDEDEEVTYYGDIFDAGEAFDRAVKYMYHQFELGYDSAEILLKEDILIDGTRLCTITSKNLANEKDMCKVIMKKRVMN